MGQEQDAVKAWLNKQIWTSRPSGELIAAKIHQHLEDIGMCGRDGRLCTMCLLPGREVECVDEPGVTYVVSVLHRDTETVGLAVPDDPYTVVVDCPVASIRSHS